MKSRVICFRLHALVMGISLCLPDLQAAGARPPLSSGEGPIATRTIGGPAFANPGPVALLGVKVAFGGLPVDASFYFLSDTNRSFLWTKTSIGIARNAVNRRKAAIDSSVPVLPAVTTPATGETPGQKIVAFCREHLGQQVGDGECAALAAAALRQAGARLPGRDYPGQGDYVWGELVCYVQGGGRPQGNLTDIKPGDIIQFRDARFSGRNREGSGTYSLVADHHTAVVVALQSDRVTLSCYAQHGDGTSDVRASNLYLDDLREGWLRFYRPIPRPVRKMSGL